MMQKGNLELGDIVWADFDPSVGHEYQNIRPAIIIQSNKQLHRSNLATVIAFTSNIKNRHADDVLVRPDKKNNLSCDSVAKVHYIATFDYCRFIKKIGKLDSHDIQKIKKYLKIHFDI